MKRPVSARSGIYRITLDAMFIAIFVILSMVPSTISWASLPALVCAFLLGPGDVLAVVTIGSFIEQMGYGLSFASLVWMAPWILFGLFAGCMAALARKNEKLWKTVVIIVCAELLLSIANTAALLYFGYVNIDPSAFAQGMPLWLVTVLTYVTRMPQGILRAVLSSVVIPLLLPPLRRTLSRLGLCGSPRP